MDKPRLRLSTFESYEYVVTGRIKPGIGRIPLAKLELRDVQRMLDGLLSNLSGTSRRHTYTVLRIALGRAVKQQVIARNVCTLIGSTRATPEPMSFMTRYSRIHSSCGKPAVRSSYRSAQSLSPPCEGARARPRSPRRSP